MGVLYKCPECDTPMCVFLGEKEEFCHHCGISIYWGGVIQYINSWQSDKIDADKDGFYELGLLQAINKSNKLETKMTTPCYIVEEDNKC